jgi:hypothetical protein
MAKKINSAFLAEMKVALMGEGNIQQVIPGAEVPPLQEETTGQLTAEQIAKCVEAEPTCRDTWEGNEKDNEIATFCNTLLYCKDYYDI